MINSIKIASFQGNKDVLLPRCKSNIALLHPSSMKRLQLQIWSLVLVKSAKGQILLKSWPYELLEESVIALPEASLYKHYATSKSTIEQYKGHIFRANRVILSPTEYKKFMGAKSFKRFLQDYLECVYLKEGMVLHVSYLGYPCCFTVNKISNMLNNNALLSNVAVNFSNAIESIDNIALLETSFNEKCNINKSFMYEERFQSSTPISSPKVTQNAHQDLSSLKDTSTFDKFFYVHKKTHIFVERECVQEQLGVKFEDIGSLDEEINCIKSVVESLLSSGSDSKSKGIFFLGPPGSAKSMIVKAVQTEYKHELSIYMINKNLCRSESGSITYLKNMFKDAQENSPSILILDDIDQLFEADTVNNKTKNEKAWASKVSSMIHNLLVSVPGILVIATSLTESPIHDNLQKHAVLEKEIRLSIPSAIDRMQILSKMSIKYNFILTPQEVKEISEMAHGFTGSDFKRLCEKATQRNHLNRTSISFLNLKQSLDFIKPSSLAELRFEVPNVRWTDIGGMDEVKNAVKKMVDWPLKYPERFKKLGITPSRGILMYGPPGCCKTMIAKALATESQLNFIYIKDSQVFSMYVGDSEKSISEIFKKARSAAPCVLFFDEVESVAPKRGSSNGSSVADRVITQILIELDGIDVLQEGVSVIAATNQPHRIDPSLLRPGRLDHLIYVPLPDAPTRREIFDVILHKKSVSPEVDVSYLVDKTEGYTGAEISDICSKACMRLIKEDLTSATSVLKMEHFKKTLEYVKPRTSQEMLQNFENYKNSKVFKL